MNTFIKAADQNGSQFPQLKQKFVMISVTKIKEGMSPCKMKMS
jgi:hypothetical protein